MKTILAFDTTTEHCSVALLTAQSVYSSQAIQKNSHADSILELVNDLLSQASASLADIDAIAVAIGPGSFTGIRIGLSVVQGLAFGLHVPVIGISSLEMMAYQIGLAAISVGAKFNTVCPAIDARMGDIYWQSFTFTVPANEGALGLADSMKTVSQPIVGKPNDLHSFLAHERKGVLKGGSGWTYAETAEPIEDVFDLSLGNNAEDLIQIAQVKIKRGELLSAFEIQPLYVRDEITWKKRVRLRESSQ